MTEKAGPDRVNCLLTISLFNIRLSTIANFIRSLNLQANETKLKACRNTISDRAEDGKYFKKIQVYLASLYFLVIFLEHFDFEIKAFYAKILPA